MREYRQLTEENHIEIYAMKQADKKQNEIASELGVPPSTIRRELSRNTGHRPTVATLPAATVTPNPPFLNQANK